MSHTIYSSRLEALREELGINSLQGFVSMLNQDPEEEPLPYATVRRYHRDREPPPSYLERVARTFGVRLHWLHTGEGPVRQPSDWPGEEAPENVLADIKAGFNPDRNPMSPGLPDGTALSRHALFHAWALRHEAYRRAVEEAPDQELSGSLSAGVAMGVGKALRATLDALDVEPEELSERVWDVFVLGMTQAIAAVADAPPAPASITTDLSELADRLDEAERDADPDQEYAPPRPHYDETEGE